MLPALRAPTWSQIYSDGIVFLPATGYRNESTLIQVGSCADYLSSTPKDSDGRFGRFMSFTYTEVTPNDYYDRYTGGPIRLVTE